MTEGASDRTPYWERFTVDDKNAGADLAALRKGLGRDPGSVPEMWRFHTRFPPDEVAAWGGTTPGFTAEHAALTLFAVHQQARRRSMHQPGFSIGKALRMLRDNDKTSAEAVDRRVTAAATATGVTELVAHLRGLVTQLRGIEQPLDYRQLMQDISDWNQPQRRSRVRRRWGIDYYAKPVDAGEKAAPTFDA